MRLSDTIGQKLKYLKMRMDQVNSAWTVNDYESLLKFYVEILPKTMGTERCSIFFVEPGSDMIWLMYGTGLKEKEIKPPKEGTVVGDAISTGKCIIRNNIDMKTGYHAELASNTGFITRNIICAPIKSMIEEGVTGAIEILNKVDEEKFTIEDGEFLQKVANYLSTALENLLLNQEILQLSNQLSREVDRIYDDDTRFVAESSIMQKILDTVRVVSATPVNVLIHGESGTGKEAIADMIHKGSERKDRRFVTVNCASIPENLMESEFFGYEKGAFTGAVKSREGRFEAASGGTLFLDEIGEMPMAIQPKFLRVLQEGEGSRLGSNKTSQYDLRIISATNKDLRKEVANGLFREDLFYRIFSVEIYIPPLRERQEDIVPLAMLFTEKISKRFKKTCPCFSPELLDFFERYPWPGNVRQLYHEVERLIALTPEGQMMSSIHCSQELLDWGNTGPIINISGQPTLPMSEKVKELEVTCIKDALLTTRGNKVRASRLLGITRQGLDKKIKRYKIDML